MTLCDVLIIQNLSLTLKNDHPIAILSFDPCLMATLISRLMSQVCVFGPFIQADGSAEFPPGIQMD